MKSEMLRLFPETAYIDEQGQLYLGGCAVGELAQQFGTPLYVFDELTLRHRCQAYRTALTKYYPAPSQVAYASKAYLCLAIAQLFAEEGLALDVVSGGEMHVARAAGFPVERVTFHGNNKSRAELVQALAWGVGRIAVDNLDELKLLEEIIAQSHSERSEESPPISIWLRLSPGIEAHTHMYNRTGLLDSKFGLPITTGDAEKALKYALSLSFVRVLGLHAHIGSQILDVRPFEETVRILLDFAAEMRGKYGFALHEFIPGGGLGVRYTPEDPDVPLDSFVQKVSQAVVEGCQRHALPLPKLILEPGRSIVGPAGVTIYTVGARKVIPGVRTYVSIDGGMADNIRPALYQARYSVLAANKADKQLAEKVTIAGKYCESGDILVRDVLLPPLQPGDLLALPKTGAYCLSMASNYNLANRPAVIMVRDGQARLIQRRESYEDLLRRDLPL